MESNFTLTDARQTALAATGPRKKLPFATDEVVLAVLQAAEATHDDAVFDVEILAEESRQRQLLLNFAPAVRKVYTLWRELAIGGRQTILSYSSEACPIDQQTHCRLVDSQKEGVEKQLLLEFLPAFAEATISSDLRRMRDAERNFAARKSTQLSEGTELGDPNIVEARLLTLADRDLWRIYDIALKRLQHGAEKAVGELEKRGKHRPKELAGLEAFAQVIADEWVVPPNMASAATFSSKFDYVTTADGQTEYLPKSPAAKFIWEASKFLNPPCSGEDPFSARRYTVQNCESVMDYVIGGLRGKELGSNS